ncbi:uncharacterized protein LOC113470159 [Diaphorina citri]|uniref:Uncharacterized protein LOC113470159 n=1 Tax=Diaphorina citri TaxID=121845 RepID=A0A3Q0J6X0_DIACI|nr:uncharacterized protein LOC113470159 [Diaphorina citri]
MDFALNKADSRNLPKVDMVTVLEFFKTNSNFFLSELRGIKAQRSTRDNYGDVAIGRVEVGRNQSHCIVRGEVTPEHKVNLSAYKVSITLNEVQDVIEEAKCCGCKGAASGCKHII